MAATTITETTLRPDGRQVPLPFELAYDPAMIEPSHTYALRATIRSGSRLAFTTTTPTASSPGATPPTPTSCSPRSGRRHVVPRRDCGAPRGCWKTSPALE